MVVIRMIMIVILIHMPTRSQRRLQAEVKARHQEDKCPLLYPLFHIPKLRLQVHDHLRRLQVILDTDIMLVLVRMSNLEELPGLLRNGSTGLVHFPDNRAQVHRRGFLKPQTNRTITINVY